MSKSKIFFILCLAFIFGIAAHSFFSAEKRIGEPFWWYVGFLSSGVIGAVLKIKEGHIEQSPSLRLREGWGGLRTVLRARGWVVGLCVAIFLLGIFRYSQAIPRVDENHVLHYVGREVTVRGVVDSFPRFREKTAAYVVKAQSVILSPDVRDRGEGPRAFSDGILPRSVRQNDTEVNGKLLLTAELFPKYDFGDELTFVCAPERLGKYEQYARREGVSVACAFPEHIAILPPLRVRGGAGELRADHNPTHPPLILRGGVSEVRATLYQIRQSFHTRLTSLFPDPYGGLLAGLLYGDTSGFSRPLKDAFRMTGISHITALSGYNVTILAHLLIGMLITLWLTRKQALPIAFALIIAFVVLTGAEASVVRAAVMGFLLMGAKGIGRLGQMRIALTFAGAVMLAVNPSLLRFDFGFQLSFLATIALLWFSRDIETRTWVRFLPKPFKIREAAAASSAAILFTAPLILYVTGMIGPLSLLVNILVVPVVPFAMAFGFAAVAADFLVHEAGLIISWLARVLLGYIIEIAEYFARFGALQVQISLWTAAVVMGVMVMVIRQWKKKYKMISNSPS